MGSNVMCDDVVSHDQPDASFRGAAMERHRSQSIVVYI